jgi:hypothetical protein
MENEKHLKNLVVLKVKEIKQNKPLEVNSVHLKCFSRLHIFWHFFCI